MTELAPKSEAPLPNTFPEGRAGLKESGPKVLRRSDDSVGMNSSLCLVNPRYNGRHTCPQCGAESFWRCLDATTARIKVECQDGCGTYEKAHSELKSLPFFEIAVVGAFAYERGR